MQTQPLWRRGRLWAPVARVVTPPPNRMRLADPVADAEVFDALRRCPAHYSTFGTNTWPEMFFNNGPFSAVANTTSETSLLGGLNLQPVVAPPTWAAAPGSAGRSLRFEGRGYFGTTGTPTLTFKFYLSTSVASLSGTTVGASAAVTTGSGVSNKQFRFLLDLVCATPGQGASNTTLYASGFLTSPGGFASPFEYTVTPGAGDSATDTATVDGSVVQYFNCSAQWSAASASDTITLRRLQAWGWN